MTSRASRRQLIPRIVCSITLVVFVGCSIAPTTKPSETQPVIVLKDWHDRDAAVGCRVRLEGEVSADKQPDIAGIDIDNPTRPIAGSNASQVDDLRGRQAWAEGVLIRYVVTPDDLIPGGQNRGAGTFYSLIDPFTGQLAVAHAMTRQSDR